MSKLSKQDLKRAKRREKKNFRQAMEKELRELYTQLIQQVKVGIVTGAFPPGERLPSVQI